MFMISNNWKTEGTILIGLFSNYDKDQITRIKEQFNIDLEYYIRESDVSPSYKHVEKITIPYEKGMKRLYVLGLGTSADMKRDHFRKAVGHAFQVMQKDGTKTPSLWLESFISREGEVDDRAAMIAESMIISTYQLPSFKTDEEEAVTIEKLTVLTDYDEAAILNALEKGHAFADGVNTARYLVHLPANILTSTEMAEFATTMAEDYDFSLDILEKEDMEELGMGALLAVNQGSVEPPKMIVLKYQGLDEWKDVTAFVGKGITYDTGGYSIKTKAGMPGMKGDMGGAAAVLGAMETIGQMKPARNVIAVIPSTDNMISGAAFKPDDVITSMSGKTIEVLNTDAEGRLALADGVTYAQSEGADRVIDVATLTGGVVTALGSWMTGAMTNNRDFYQEVEHTGETFGEPIWLLPYNEDYQAQVRKSSIADLNNSPTRKAHAIMGGAFVGAFVEKVPWVHLDIAGTSIAEASYELGPKGPTGVMAKTLAGYIIQ
ncbi:leucyl aminopeptidase [Halobacillus litoralis]|uniref:Probable cytosol aminopeptidase n=1 Tax=Halobacillus litoralis TaxID=45668 RepID=A0A410MGR2_9BACI|nr:leucyl aminopeptidase [Halobacillus litoralis]QAS53855.1 leucyl aminopeptidase [Halobacillus litoralis]